MVMAFSAPSSTGFDASTCREQQRQRFGNTKFGLFQYYCFMRNLKITLSKIADASVSLPNLISARHFSARQQSKSGCFLSTYQRESHLMELKLLILTLSAS